MSINTPQEKKTQEKASRPIDEEELEELVGFPSLQEDSLVWNQLISTQKADHSSLPCSSGSCIGENTENNTSNELNKLDEIKQDSISASSISNSILQSVLSDRKAKEIKFSIKTKGHQAINVLVREKKNLVVVNIKTNNKLLKEKINSCKSSIEDYVGQELDKRVSVSVK